MTEPRYFDDSLRLEFQAEIEEIIPLPDGKLGVILPFTYFYPTSGGQEHDTGTLGLAYVLDVYKQDDGRIVHVLDRQPGPAPCPARIDQARRLSNMQHHTAQHILSGAFDHLLGLGTLSANINGDSPSSIYLDSGSLEPEALQQVEDFANGIVFENRLVKSYFITDSEIEKTPFRRPPKVSGSIRLIEVDGFDYSACGGTHCPQTGMIGLLKIIRTERVNQKLRIYFVAGGQALTLLQAYQKTVHLAADLLETGWEGIPEAIRLQKEKLREQHLELAGLREEKRNLEVDGLVAASEQVVGKRLVTAGYQSRTPADLRLLGSKLAEVSGVVAVLGGADAAKLSLVIACAADTGVVARELLAHLLSFVDGKGGGDAGLAQGGGTADSLIFSKLAEEARTWLASKH